MGSAAVMKAVGVEKKLPGRVVGNGGARETVQQ